MDEVTGLREGDAFYGQNAHYVHLTPMYQNNCDGTILDLNTGLMGSQTTDINGDGVMNTNDKLIYAEDLAKIDDVHLAGYDDWRLPIINELQNIVDDTKSPDTSASPAINVLVSLTSFQNENLEQDWRYDWSSTTPAYMLHGSNAADISFGKALGYKDCGMDIHGTGAQRSDPKSGNPSQ